MKEPVTIVGAGIGGLVLASILHRRGVEVVVHEGEASPHARSQGGLLDLHEESGQLALRRAGLHDRFLELVRRGEDAKRIVDRSGAVLLDRPGDAAATRPEIDRGDLRRLLLGSLPSDTVRWGSKVVAIGTTREGHRLGFGNGDTRVARLLVGADGAWSRVRRLLTDARPLYTGLCFLELRLAADDPRASRAARVVGGGTLMACAPGLGILAHRNQDGSITGYIAIRRDETWVAAFEAGGGSRALSDALSGFDGWAPELRELLAVDELHPTIRPIRALPVGLEWARMPGVTLVGDAAHLMSPFAGVGANLAMLDAAELAEALTDAGDDPEPALASYESRMFDRSGAMAARSAANLRSFFGTDSPGSVVSMFGGP